MNCQYCETKSIVFTLTCEGCRNRLVQAEECKFLRKIIVNHFELMYGEFTDWKAGQSCDCKISCKRKQAIKHDKDEYVEQANNRRTKVSRRR